MNEVKEIEQLKKEVNELEAKVSFLLGFISGLNSKK